ncbi:hypothetical protein JCM16358_14560 [Halanaerocella petrolearia]
MRRVTIIIGTSLTLICLLLLVNKTAFVLQDQSYNPDNLLRLHVIANSNSLADQHLKRQVRDALVKSGKKLFTGVTDISQAEIKVKTNLKELTRIAQHKVRQAGKNYQVDLKLGEYNFPMRSYGDITLASGDYKALRVVIGEGRGENWWCVLFPPLCFVDSVDEIPKRKVGIKSKQKQVKKELKVDFRFKLAEYLDSKSKFVKNKLKLGEIFSKSN